MEFEGLICPKCSSSLDEKELTKNLSCPHCGTKFHNKKYIAFIEYLMMNGIVTDIDFFDRTLYGDEIKYKSETEEELVDETNPDDYEDKTSNIDYIEESSDLKEVTTDEEEFRNWEGIEEDWQEFNRKNNPDNNKNN